MSSRNSSGSRKPAILMAPKNWLTRADDVAVRGDMTDGGQEGVKTNLGTGAPDDTGAILDVTHVVAGIMTLMGANSTDYLPSVTPLTAMVGA